MTELIIILIIIVSVYGRSVMSIYTHMTLHVCMGIYGERVPIFIYYIYRP